MADRLVGRPCPAINESTSLLDLDNIYLMMKQYIDAIYKTKEEPNERQRVKEIVRERERKILYEWEKQRVWDKKKSKLKKSDVLSVVHCTVLCVF